MVAGGAVVEQWVAVVVVAIEASTKPSGRRKRGRYNGSQNDCRKRRGSSVVQLPANFGEKLTRSILAPYILP
jgi:hypothetical protein